MYKSLTKFTVIIGLILMLLSLSACDFNRDEPTATSPVAIPVEDASADTDADTDDVPGIMATETPQGQASAPDEAPATESAPVATTQATAAVIASPTPDLRCTTTAVPSLNVRQGPGTNYAIVIDVPTGTVFNAAARNSDASWVMGTSTHSQGWVSATYLDCTYDLTTLPVTEVQPPTATPTVVIAPDASATQTVLNYYALVNSGDYESAWAMLTPTFQAVSNSYQGYLQWVTQFSDIAISNTYLLSQEGGRAYVAADVYYYQPNGQVSDYSGSRYELVWDSSQNRWLINGASQTDTHPPTATPAPESNSPADAVYRYYNLVNAGDYESAWNMLDIYFQQNSGGYDAYIDWWNKVQTAQVGRVQVQHQEGNSAIVQAQLRYWLHDGRLIDDPNPKIVLFKDGNGNWYFYEKGP